MINIFKASLYKMVKDITFRITLIIGGAFTLIMTLLYFAMDYGFDTSEGLYLTGPSMMFNSMSPMQNFGFVLPIMLIIYVCLEFSQGIVRNKIIAGYSKIEVYFGLLLSALVFTFGIMVTYVLLNTFIGFAFSGFRVSGDFALGLLSASGTLSWTFILKIVAIFVVTYLSIVCYTVFIATVFRSVGPCIPLVMVVLMACYIVASLVSTIALLEDSGLLGIDVSTVKNIAMTIDPLYAITGGVSMDETTTELTVEFGVFISALANNLIYSVLFTTFGALLFRKRDVK